MIVYCAKNRVNNKKYVGCTIEDIDTRWMGHLSDAKRDSTLVFHCAIRKYGPDAFELETLETFSESSTIEDLKAAEIKWIADLHTFGLFEGKYHGYNMTRGGDGTWGHRHSEETKKKQSLIRIGTHPTDETRAKQSEAQRARFADPEKYAAYRLARENIDMSYCKTPEFIDKIRKLHLGRKRPEGTGDKISKALKARNATVSDDMKQRISDKLKGNKCAKRCPVARLDENGSVVAIYETTFAAARSIGKKSPGHIINCCKGRQTHAHGYIWKYASDVSTQNFVKD